MRQQWFVGFCEPIGSRALATVSHAFHAFAAIGSYESWRALCSPPFPRPPSPVRIVASGEGGNKGLGVPKDRSRTERVLAFSLQTGCRFCA